MKCSARDIERFVLTTLIQAPIEAELIVFVPYIDVQAGERVRLRRRARILSVVITNTTSVRRNLSVQVSMYDFHKSIPASPRSQILLKVAVGLVIPLVSCSKTSLMELIVMVMKARVVV